MTAVTRTEHDALGAVEVSADRYWGAQTQRSIENFPIGRDRFVWGREIVEAFGLVKWAAAEANVTLERLSPEIGSMIEAAADEVIDGTLDDHFPLVVWQTGSGTQTNMNANEVIANRAAEQSGAPMGAKDPVHPNDHVNASQSSNDTFPTAMHVAIVLALHRHLYPATLELRDVLAEKAVAFSDVVKVGRTHLQDATPITLGQEIGAWVHQIDAAVEGIRRTEDSLAELAIGGTAVGTGLNAPHRFGPLVAEALSERTGHAFVVAGNRFAALAAHDALATTSGTLRTLAGALLKIANDVRWLASGPRNGIGELVIPANEPGSSIMPGKVNPTQAEALTMVCVQVFGNDAAVAMAASQGNFQLNVYKPVMAHNVLESIALVGDACRSFTEHCAAGLEPNREVIARNLDRNLMLVTALNPHIGYDAAASIAKRAHAEGSSLRDAAVASGEVTAEQFDEWVDPIAMTRPG